MRFSSVSFQTSGSTDTITSSSSADGDLDHQGSSYHSKGDHSGIQYSNLLDDDDSGIVMRTNSQSSLDRTKFESSYQYKVDSESLGSLSEQKFPPPRPAPRRSVTSNSGPNVEDRLIGAREIARERPKPAPRKLSFENSSPNAYGSNKQSNSNNESLIDFDATTPPNNAFSLVDQFDQLDASGDYVLLRHPKTVGNPGGGWESGSKRNSVSRTPAMKLGQNETPKRPSIRRERSPLSPDDSPQTSLLDFDPLSTNSFSQHSSASSVAQSTNEVKNKTIDQSDSLLKDWDIKHLASVTNTQNPPVHRASYMYGQHPTPPPRQPVSRMTQQFYTPQPNMTQRQTGSALGFHNPMSQLHSPAPQVPPRPKHRPSPGNTNSQSTIQSNDPFADLLNLNQSGPQTTSPNAASWETFN